MAPGHFGCLPHGILRPGHDVRVVNLSAGGALVECGARLRPDASTELHILHGRLRLSVRARVCRCRIARLDPLVYEAALRFEGLFDPTGG